MSPLTVMNTRPREQAPALSRLLRASGFEVVEAPAIVVLPALDTATLDALRHDLRDGHFRWVVLASQNAGRQLAADLRACSTPIACGTATAQALALQPTLALDRFSAAAALDALRSEIHRGDHVLLPRAAEGREELVDGLAALGAEVMAPVVYRTVPAADATARLHAGGIDVVTLCSPSAVAAVAPAIGVARVVCLGATTAAAAAEAGLRVDAVAPHTSMAALVEAVEAIAGAARV